MSKNKPLKRRSMEAAALRGFKPKRKPSLKVYSRKAKYGKASRKWEAFDILGVDQVTAAIGKMAVTVVPLLGILVISRRPPWSSTNCLASGRPSPVPSALFER